jgi:competence protein ComEA
VTIKISSVLKPGSFFLERKEELAILAYCFLTTAISGLFLLWSVSTPQSAHADPFPNSPQGIWVDVAGKVKNPGVYSLGKDARINDAINAAGGVVDGVDLVSLNLAERVMDGEEIIIGVSKNPTPTKLIFANPPNSTSPSSPTSSAASTNMTTLSTASTSSTTPSATSSNLSFAPARTATSKATTPASSSLSVTTKTSSSRSKKAVPTSLININSASVDQLQSLPGVGPVMAQKIIAFRSKYGKFKKIADIENVSGLGAGHYTKIKPYITV